MIRYIKGTYTMQFENGIVVETGSGVGFEIFVHQGSPYTSIPKVMRYRSSPK